MQLLRKIMAIKIICVLIVILVIAAPVSAGKLGFLKKLLPEAKSLKKIARELPAGTKKLSKSDIRKALPDIDPKKLTPDLLKVAAVGSKIEKSGKFGSKFINNVGDPAEVIRQYGRYGPTYLKTAETFSKTVGPHAQTLAKMSNKELKKFGNLTKNTIGKFTKEDFAQSAFVSTVRRTGKHGYETFNKIAKWANAHRKSAFAAGLLIWYTTDPEGCIDTIGDVGHFLGKGGTEVTTKVSSEIGRGAKEAVLEIWRGASRQYFIIGTLLLLIIFLLSNRICRRLLFFPLKMIGGKLNTYMDRKETQTGETKEPRVQKVKSETVAKDASTQPPAGRPDDQEAKGIF